MEARYTTAGKEAFDLSYLVAILRNHLIFWKNTPPDGVLYIDASQPARDRKRCCAAGSHSWPRALRYCSFVNSYRFMLIASHNLLSCSTLIFQTRPNIPTLLRDKVSQGRAILVDLMGGSYNSLCIQNHFQNPQ